MKNHNWSKPYFGVSHFVKDRIQYTIENRGQFAVLMIFSWIAYKLVSRETFYLSDFLSEKEMIDRIKNIVLTKAGNL